MIKIIQGDITTLAVDSIVNAANQMMLGGVALTGRFTARRAKSFLKPVSRCQRCGRV